ncbi:hypothetical protein BDN71DRAFT_772888 [Pleurotus eryngii]|uniref:Uncharacterized protein n=1 Tax=Pleurotus eryngii TaxID=5323 RepID=A0A9P5ZZ12_PLEER|nr:hypothetical protein BDN71DRAFT_772888 [Pleurotus eryngii]
MAPCSSWLEKSCVKNKPIEHTRSHGLESFAWVFTYVVPRRLLRDSGDETNSTGSKVTRIAVEKVYDHAVRCSARRREKAQVPRAPKTGRRHRHHSSWILSSYWSRRWPGAPSQTAVGRPAAWDPASL